VILLSLSIYSLIDFVAIDIIDKKLTHIFYIPYFSIANFVYHKVAYVIEIVARACYKVAFCVRIMMLIVHVLIIIVVFV